MNFEEMSEKEILEIANPIMDNLMKASTEIDHECHVLDFTDRMKEIVTKEHLEKVCKKFQSDLGAWLNREVVAVFRRPNSAIVVWKQYCSKAKGEYKAEIILVFKDNKFLVDGAMVF